MDETMEAIARESSADEPSRAYARLLCQTFVEGRDRIDGRIRAALEHWELDRINTVERNVLRVATVELVRQDIPPKVVMNEAIEVAREFGTAASPGFVNGVLDAVFKQVETNRRSGEGS